MSDGPDTRPTTVITSTKHHQLQDIGHKLAKDNRRVDVAESTR
jgi:hypothetical protein